MRAAVKSYVDQLNAGLTSHETIKSSHLLHRDFDIERGELTPSLKLKRRRIEQQHAPLLDELYS